MAGCQTIPAKTQLAAGTVASVNGAPITLAQLDDAIRTSGKPDSAGLRQTLKQRLIARELLRQRAEAEHYEGQPAVQAARIDAEIKLYLNDHAKPAPVTDEQVRGRYDAIVATLGVWEYKARVLSVTDEASAAQVTKALAVGKPFDDLARQYSIAPSREQGGELPWVSFKTPLIDGQTQGLPVSVAAAITKLEPGMVTRNPVVVGPMRVWVKLEARRATVVPGFEQARSMLRQQLQSQAGQQATARLIHQLAQSATIVQ
jgi:parvulin-like peptidyl-prolyl isomerase